MNKMTYTIREEAQLIPAFKFAKRLLTETKKPIVITIAKKKNKRSLNQNAYYWGVVLKVIGDELGYFPEEMHKTFAKKFLKRFIDIGDECIAIGGSTKRLKTNEFEEYLENIRIFASSELGILVPLPNEILDEEWEND